MTGDFPPLSVHNPVSLPASRASGPWRYCGRALAWYLPRGEHKPRRLLFYVGSRDGEFPVVVPNPGCDGHVLQVTDSE